MIDVSIVITDHDWSDDLRPCISIAEDLKSAFIRFGKESDHVHFEIQSDLIEHELDGIAEIFNRAAEVVRNRRSKND